MAGFLDLCDLQAAAGSVHRAGRNEETVARPGRVGVHQLIGRTLLAGLIERAGVGVFPKAHPDPGIGFRFQDIPEFRLAVLAETFGGHRIVGMHLYRQAVFDDEPLDQQRKIQVMPFEDLIADQVAHIGFQNVGQVVFGQVAFRDHGGLFVESAEIPELAAPGLRHPLGLELERIQFFH